MYTITWQTSLGSPPPSCNEVSGKLVYRLPFLSHTVMWFDIKKTMYTKYTLLAGIKNTFSYL